CALRFIVLSVLHFTMADVPPGNKLTSVTDSLCSFGDLHNRGNVQSRVAPRTFLPGCHSRIFPTQVDIGWNRMRASWTVGQSFGVIVNECFHSACPSLHRTQM